MVRPRIIPILLLNGTGLVKGRRFKDFQYVGDAINTVRIFNEKNADEIFLFDINATNESRTILSNIVKKIADECYMPFGVGGGIRTIAQIKELLRSGAEKVSLNSSAVENPHLIKQASQEFGSQSITISIDVKKNILGKYQVITHCGKKKTGLDPVEWAFEVQERGAGEILVTSIDRDGTGKGYDSDIIQSIMNAVTIQVVACGGAGTYRDLFDVFKKKQASAAAAGSLFVFKGNNRAVLVNYPENEFWDSMERGHWI